MTKKKRITASITVEEYQYLEELVKAGVASSLSHAVRQAIDLEMEERAKPDVVRRIEPRIIRNSKGEIVTHKKEAKT